MGFFGKKRRDTLTAPQTQSTPRLGQVSNLQRDEVSPQSAYNLTHQRPTTSDGASRSHPMGGQEYPAPAAVLRKHKKINHSMSNLNLTSEKNVPSGDVPGGTTKAQSFGGCGTATCRQLTTACPCGEALYSLVSSKLNTIVTLIDSGRFSGDEQDLALSQSSPPIWEQQNEYRPLDASTARSKGVANDAKSTLAITSANYFAKADLYSNSRLPRNLPPMKLYLPTFPLLCLAAQYSEQVYAKPSGQEKETHVGADWRTGTKAMVIKSVPMDDMNIIVFAIRGSQTFMDWAVNLNSTPVSPEGFLDDPENYCHAGFLSVARKMIGPVAARLRQLIEELPDRSSYSLLITGHSAGGAVAALLYSHMLATSRRAGSELNLLTGCFKRVHCVTFGAPPISLFPLVKPPNPGLRKSLFLSFVNEGDPVTRADRAYVRSLLELYVAPAPKGSYTPQSHSRTPRPVPYKPGSKSSSSLTVNKTRPAPKKSNTAPTPSAAPIWKVPDIVLSNAGRLILLRGMQRGESPSRRKLQERMDDGVVAQMVTDEILRNVIWGDPVSHMMRLYLRRVEVLATNAVTGRAG